jgi:hypothetical protein
VSRNCLYINSAPRTGAPKVARGERAKRAIPGYHPKHASGVQNYVQAIERHHTLEYYCPSSFTVTSKYAVFTTPLRWNCTQTR